MQKRPALQIRDISTPLRSGFPVWPGHTPPAITTPLSHEAGDGVQLTRLELGAHTGTHLDAPRHFIPSGGLVTGLDLSVLIGSAQVVHYPGEGPISAAFMESLDLPPDTTRILLRCDHNAGRLHESDAFFTEYAAITPDAAHWMVARGVRLVGTDYLSIGPYYGGNDEVHIALLGDGIVIVEGLDLRDVAPGEYTLICLPIALPSDGAPCRAVLLPAHALTGMPGGERAEV